MAGSESTIGALLDETGGSIKTGPFGTKLKASEYTATGVPVISVGEVGFGRLRVHHDTPRVDETVFSRMPEFLLKAGDIVFGRKGAVERSAQVQPDEDGYFLGSDGIRIRLNVEECDPKFISYQLQTTAHRSWMIQHAAGTTMPSLNEGIIRRIPIVLKPVAEQKAIAAVLGALDDKIELNRRMNATLEAMARALFQSWFVDFDPVRAKLDGHPPAALDPATAALFPDHLEDSPFGHIPKGWTAQRLPDAIEVNPRRTLKGGTIAPYLDMKNLPMQGHSAEEVIDREFSSGTKFQKGDTLLARITPCLENGKTGYVDFLEDGQVGWGSTEYIVLAPKPPLSPQFGYLLARSDALRTHTIQNMTGTSGRQRVPSECFNTFWLAVPPPNIARRFDELTAPLMAKIKANADQSRTLATLRDTLLPKLLSGELSVADTINHTGPDL
jgi:type I restriction enzyme S subunit